MIIPSEERIRAFSPPQVDVDLLLKTGTPPYCYSEGEGGISPIFFGGEDWVHEKYIFDSLFLCRLIVVADCVDVRLVFDRILFFKNIEDILKKPFIEFFPAFNTQALYIINHEDASDFNSLLCYFIIGN